MIFTIYIDIILSLQGVLVAEIRSPCSLRSIGSKLFRTKTIKLKVRPTPQELVGELELLTCMLDNIVRLAAGEEGQTV